MVEQAIFITRVADLKFVNSKYDRIYFGNEFCERLIPSARELSDVAGYCREHGLGLSLVTPYVTRRGLEALDRLFSWLRKNKMTCEVVINDYGVLDVLNKEYPEFTLVLGRLLTKQKRDPRIVRLNKTLGLQREFLSLPEEDVLEIFTRAPKALLAHFQEANISVPIIQEFLKEYQIVRAEIDNLLQGIRLCVPQKGLGVSLYFPYGYIATSRLCPALPFHKSHQFSRRILTCKKECRDLCWRLKNAYFPTVVYKVGSTIFFKNEKTPSLKELTALGINRLVYQPKIPI
jgi:hypothetical protein